MFWNNELRVSYSVIFKFCFRHGAVYESDEEEKILSEYIFNTLQITTIKFLFLNYVVWLPQLS